MNNIILIISSLVLVFTSFNGNSQENAFGEISYNEAVNISGMQRMLSQRITKIYLTKLNGAKGDNLENEYRSSLQLFNKNFTTLEGNSKKASSKVQELIIEQKKEWKIFMDALLFKRDTDVFKVLENSNTLLKKCHSLVLAIEEDSKAKNKVGGGNQFQVETVNTSGKQRMLSQRLSVHYIAIRILNKEKKDTSGVNKILNDVYQEMEVSLKGLTSNKLNTSDIQSIIGSISNKFSFVQTQSDKFKNNRITLKEMYDFSNAMTKLYNDLTTKYTSL